MLRETTRSPRDADTSGGATTAEVVPAMAVQDASARSTYQKTRHRGLVYRERSNGKTFYGFIPGRGRSKLQATTHDAALAEYNELRGKVAKGEKIAPTNLRFRDVAEEWWTQ